MKIFPTDYYADKAYYKNSRRFRQLKSPNAWLERDVYFYDLGPRAVAHIQNENGNNSDYNLRSIKGRYFAGQKYSKGSKRRSYLLEAFGNLCCWCKTEFTEDNPATLEHVYSTAYGGKDTNSNLKLSHKRCNEWMGTLSRDVSAYYFLNEDIELGRRVSAWLHRENNFSRLKRRTSIVKRFKNIYKLAQRKISA